MVRTILHIDLDCFFVSVERMLAPELEGKPVVVGGVPGGRGVVACASYEARRFGLHAGMPLVTAQRLCPNAVYLKGRFERYRQASEGFMALLRELTPQVEPLGLDETYLDLTGFEPFHGPAYQAALKLQLRIRDELGLGASIGIASSKVVAKVASERAKPGGVIQVAPGEEQVFLAPLPIAALPGVGRKTELVLRRMGITSIGQLAAVPPHLLKRRLGAAGEVLQGWSCGVDPRKVEPPGSAKSISRETTFPQDIGERRFLKAALRYLSERVGAELRSQGKQARCITLKLRYTDFETISRSRSLKRPGDADQLIFEVGWGLLKKALDEKPRLVRLIGIGVSNLVIGGKQLHLFDRSEERRERLSFALDRIRQRYGFAAIEVGATLPLRSAFAAENNGYVLLTPSLTR